VWAGGCRQFALRFVRHRIGHSKAMRLPDDNEFPEFSATLAISPWNGF
jgi:hypothetical protein